ncbi:MAG: L-threonylcarbamoyladenylate synthase, partial [Coriobacteriales bacterium]
MSGNVYKVDLAHPQDELLEKAASYLKRGEALIFPTDTVYGIGVAVANSSTPDLLFEIKRRERSLAIPWLIANLGDLQFYGRNVRDYCKRMAEQLWPGPLTLVVEASDEVPEAFRGGDGTIALRIPNSPVTLSLIETLGCPLATTSANIHNMGAVADGAELDPRIMELVPMV